eukprot:7956882-Pyramimonas_sp.AAC.1
MEKNGWEFEYEQQRTDTTRAEPEWAMGKEPEQTYTNEKKTEHGVHKSTVFELKIGTYNAMTMGKTDTMMYTTA